MPETNPYAPPGADLSHGPAPHGRRLGWKLYLWGLAALSALVYLMFGVSWMQAADLVDLAVVCVALTGLFGYAHRRALGARGFWSAWLPLEIVWDLYLVAVLEPAALAYRLPETEPTRAGDQVLGLLLILPLYIALFLYAHRSPELWSGR